MTDTLTSPPQSDPSPASSASSSVSSARPPIPANPQRSSRSRVVLVLVLLLLATGASILAWNEFTVSGPVRAELASDSRNTGYTLRARYEHYVIPSSLVLDLREVEYASPLDVWRGLFQTASVLAEADRRFERVVLARAGTPVFLLDGDDFRRLGREFRLGENPMYMLRNLPSKLQHAETGRSAYGVWTGGWLGVATRQMEDVNDAARAWMRERRR